MDESPGPELTFHAGGALLEPLTQELWHKGATSGHFQDLKGIRYDCDADVLLLTIEQRGDVARHTGARSCFYEDGLPPPRVGSRPCSPGRCLHRIGPGDLSRRDQPEEGSYTNKLLAGGDNRILKNRGRER